MSFITASVGKTYDVSPEQHISYTSTKSASDLVTYGDKQQGMVAFNADGSVVAASSVKDNKPAGEIHTYVRDNNGQWKEKGEDGKLSDPTKGKIVQAEVKDNQLNFKFVAEDATANDNGREMTYNANVSLTGNKNNTYNATVKTARHDESKSGLFSEGEQVAKTHLTFNPNAKNEKQTININTKVDSHFESRQLPFPMQRPMVFDESTRHSYSLVERQLPRFDPHQPGLFGEMLGEIANELLQRHAEEHAPPSINQEKPTLHAELTRRPV